MGDWSQGRPLLSKGVDGAGARDYEGRAAGVGKAQVQGKAELAGHDPGARSGGQRGGHTGPEIKTPC